MNRNQGIELVIIFSYNGHAGLVRFFIVFARFSVFDERTEKQPGGGR